MYSLKWQWLVSVNWNHFLAMISDQTCYWQTGFFLNDGQKQEVLFTCMEELLQTVNRSRKIELCLGIFIVTVSQLYRSISGNWRMFYSKFFFKLWSVCYCEFQHHSTKILIWIFYNANYNFRMMFIPHYMILKLHHFFLLYLK